MASFSYSTVKQEPKKDDSDDQDNSDVDVDHHDTQENQQQKPEVAAAADEEDGNVIDLSSSGCCSWCHKHGPCALEDSSAALTASKRKLRKRFCSERCFGLHRRAMFKKNKRCEWCHTGLNENEVTIHSICGLNFCR